jgi:N4-(beta-N-acetylglucosaminyl)-L-asparaginase
MLFIANAEGWPGIPTTVEMLRSGTDSLTAMVAGISKVEAETKVRSVGHGGWPNMLGVMECDAAVMDGTTREVGSVGAVPDTIPVARLAHEVMKKLPHVMLTGAGARRFATETGFSVDDVLLEDSKRVWWERLERK